MLDYSSPTTIQENAKGSDEPHPEMIIQEMKDKNSKRYLVNRSNETQETPKGKKEETE